MKKKVLIIGGEGNGGVISSCIEDIRKRKDDFGLEVAGFLNDFVDIDEKIQGFPVLGKTADVQKFIDKDYYFIYAIHMISHGSMRRNLYFKLNIPEERLVTVVHPNAFVSHNVDLSPGVFVMANSYIGPGTKIGMCTLVMANCVIGHNDEIGGFCHFSAGSTTSSYVKIGEASDICLAASVLEKVTIGNYSVIGAHSLLTKNVGDSEIWLGSPARFHRKIEDS
jgi:sugar O-acyltransferase (sialic acid O-acetyltransferase NeuD family)